MKSVARDFIIGAVLIAVVMQILPESTTSLIKSVVGLLPLAALSSMKGGSLKTLTGGGSTESTFDDMEVQVGVPRF